MRAVRRLGWAWALWLAGGCGTRFVDLPVPADAGAGIKCETITDGTGASCQRCYGPDGTVQKDGCPDGGPASGTASSPAICKVIPTADTRCLSCAGATPYMVCLKCDAAIKVSDTGDTCRTCTWSDQTGRCLQCFAADGTSTQDDCDHLRTETLPGTTVPGSK